MTGPPPGHVVRALPDPDALFAESAKALAGALEASGTYPRLVLAGGRTPVEVYRRLGSPPHRGRGFWAHLRLTFTDERTVPPDHEASNFGMARRTLLERVDLSGDRVLRFRGEIAPTTAALRMHRRLLDWSQRVPLFDVVLLGLGEDGHVASLFPDEAWPEFGVHLAAVTRHPDGDERLTLTPRALRSSRATFILVSGEAKASAVRETLEAKEATSRFPATMIVPGGAPVVWLLDADAASGLPEAWRR